jgi:alpha-1,2-mannosyltransferase
MRRFLPFAAVVVVSLGVLTALLPSTENLGYDYQAYVRAGQRILDGQPLYDVNVETAGGFAIYLYPPPFAVAMVPFALLPDDVARSLWIGLMLVAFLAAIAVMPVRPTIRWLVLLLGGLDWPFMYALRLGQVGPFLLLLFALAWRWRDQQDRFGVVGATGAIAKLQPGLMLAWALLTRRWRAVIVGSAILVVAAAASTLVVGLAAWSDYARVLGAVSTPVTTVHNFTPGAVAYQLGVPEGPATVIQALALAGTVIAVLAAIRWSTAEASLLAAIVASQLLSPLLWDHYAVVLLLPVAYLLARGYAWAVLIPLATWFPLALMAPPIVYPIVFAIGLMAPVVVGYRERARMEPA